VAGFVIYKKGCTRRAAASDKVYQLLAHGRWFSTGSLVSSTIKTGRHDIAEILLKVALKHQKSNQIKLLKDSLNNDAQYFQRRITSHLNSLNIKKKYHYMDRNADQVQKM
jgi:hypothetical protein